MNNKNNNEDDNNTVIINETKMNMFDIDNDNNVKSTLLLSSRRNMITTTSSLLLLSSVRVKSSYAAELDKQSGELFTSKKAMLSGVGSDEARGIKLRNRSTDIISQQSSTLLTKKKYGLIQN